MKDTQTNYYWNEDTIIFFKFMSKRFSDYQVKKGITEFVESNCQLEEGETEEDLVLDLFNNVYNYS